MAYELYYYQSADGKCPFVDWLVGVSDQHTRARIEARLARVATGNLGDVKSVGGGVMELRILWGPGYRVYFAHLGQMIILLLCGGDKGTQLRDIKRAQTYFEDYRFRARKTKTPARRT